MKSSLDNPWQGMPESTQRRINSKIKHNLFWITDTYGHYGFYIRQTKPFTNLEENINLKGIDLIKRNSSEGTGEFFLILNDKDSWQIFYALCMDLVSVAEIDNNCNSMILSVENRLLRWKQLLESQSVSKMTLERQMGLFSELLCLSDILTPRFGLKTAISFWRGPEFDKQDFATKEAAIEVKSYHTTKGNRVSISSAEQLASQKEKLYLAAYGLTVAETGESIEDIVTKVKSGLQENSYEILPIFENKLIAYGYIPELFKEPLYKFVVDRITIYDVLDTFPRISPETVDPAVVSVNYTIDLSKCKDYETQLTLERSLSCD